MDTTPLAYKVISDQKPWRGGPCISVSIEGINRTIQLPVSFIEPLTWTFVATVLGYMVNEPGGVIYSAISGAPVYTQMLPTAGDYIYKPSDTGTTFTDSPGPEGKRRTQPPRPEGSDSTMSASSRSSVNQNRFRQDLRARDFFCLVTGASFSSCEASHIVPVSRDDVYRQIYGREVVTPWMYSASSGFLLTRALHHRYDNFRWSMYYEDGFYYPHFFDPEDSELKLHGAPIGTDRFRVDQEVEPPDPELCAWHYKQFVLMHIRGISVA